MLRLLRLPGTGEGSGDLSGRHDLNNLEISRSVIGVFPGTNLEIAAKGTVKAGRAHAVANSMISLGPSAAPWLKVRSNAAAPRACRAADSACRTEAWSCT